MIEAKHTPAPWTIEEYGDDEAPTLVIHRGQTENRICFMATPGSHGDPAIIEADAHLIAAAPDLLQELKRLRARYARCAALHGNTEETINTSLESVDAAIAKANGAPQ
jgi:hypothetical protein